MSEPTEADHVARIVDRLRRDHPDPQLRAELYQADKLSAYVQSLLPDGDPATVARVAAAVRAAEDGAPGPMTSAG